MKHSTEAEPDAAGALFGHRVHLARRLHDDLVSYGEQLGLVGPREIERLWTRHIINSALLAELCLPGTLADVGSGAGFPGLVIAIARPDLQCTLIEPMERRATWLSEEAQRLGLSNVEVLRARAQDVPDTEQFDTVTARAVSALRKLVPMTLPLVKPGGQLLFLKGQRLNDEIREAAGVLSRSGLVDIESLEVGQQYNTEVTRVFRATLEA